MRNDDRRVGWPAGAHVSMHTRAGGHVPLYCRGSMVVWSCCTTVERHDHSVDVWTTPSAWAHRNESSVCTKKTCAHTYTPSTNQQSTGQDLRRLSDVISHSHWLCAVTLVVCDPILASWRRSVCQSVFVFSIYYRRKLIIFAMALAEFCVY